ncbi:protocatechuate 3,4-dioxygenase subunit alpha [Kineococcus sp. R8]|uniref:protocatechuate 3,4-dioxygenase subunit alpha n=1 Tax=Kineococcus siccus TaxID=2696567 RepID=UPI00141356F3|nr:protocatechuate 3,4-dioxygenase subunit alpha [Kineococcus siccus]
MSTAAARPTPGQTVGPFFGYALPYAGDAHLVPPASPGALWLHGSVFDGLGAPVTDALLEVWQAGPDGRVPRASGSLRRDGATFTGFGRCASDGEGGYGFWTREPAAVGPSARFVAVTVFARGLLHRLLTRAYLPPRDAAEQAALQRDRLLGGLPPERARTLLATREDDGSVRFDVRLQGEGETVFLEHDPPRTP